MAKRLTCLANFLLPHWGQTGWRPGLIRFERKLKIRRHFGQANSYIGMTFTIYDLRFTRHKKIANPEAPAGHKATIVRSWMQTANRRSNSPRSVAQSMKSCRFGKLLA
jgi:hypothetical protein